MLKTFKYQNVELKVKTTMLKGGVSYFGEKDVQGELENAVKLLKFEIGKVTTEEYLLALYKKLASAGVAPVSLSLGGLEYTGVKMTELNTNKVLG